MTLDMSKDTNVDFTITFVKGKLNELEASNEHGCNGVMKLLKLSSTCSTTNMHLFDADDKLKKYDKVESIIDDYYTTRLKLYGLRKAYLIDALQKELVLLSNKAKYIQANLDGTVDLRKKKKDQVIQMLKTKGFDIIDDDAEYKYLIKMSMDSVTEENVDKLFKECGNKEAELEIVKKTTIQQMWIGELDKLQKEYLEYREDRERLMTGEAKPKKVIKKKGNQGSPMTPPL